MPPTGRCYMAVPREKFRLPADVVFRPNSLTTFSFITALLICNNSNHLLGLHYVFFNNLLMIFSHKTYKKFQYRYLLNI